MPAWASARQKLNGIIQMPLHEPQIDQQVVHDRIRLEHQQIEGQMHIEVVQDLQSIQGLINGLLAVEVT